jgi:putative FmdB family regulatory protein
MPIYEYRCRECGKEFETMVFHGEDDRDIPCPNCGRKHPERLLSGFAASISGRSGGKSCTQFR